MSRRIDAGGAASQSGCHTASARFGDRLVDDPFSLTGRAACSIAVVEDGTCLISTPEYKGGR
jgi:hypothetical protein